MYGSCSTRAVVAIVAGTLVIGFQATPVQAGAVKCKATIIKSDAAFIQAKAKALAKCEEDILKGKAPAGDCHANAKASTAIANAVAKLQTSVAKVCGGKDKICGAGGDDDTLASIGWNISACPNFDNGNCNGTIATCADVSTCLACIGEATTDRAIAISYATDPQAAKELTKCQVAIGKATTAFFVSKSKALATCWAAVNADKATNPCPVPGDGKAAAAIAKAETKTLAAICKACGGADKLCNGVGDLAPVTIGFPAQCPSAVVPDGPVCAGAVTTLTELVDCVDCVNEFAVDCADRSSVPAFVSTYPAECNPIMGPTATVTPTPATTAGAPQTSTPTKTETPTPKATSTEVTPTAMPPDSPTPTSTEATPTVDTLPPTVPTFTAARSLTRRSRVTVAFTMPGDDGTTGTVTSYSLVQRICNAGDACTIAGDAEFAAATLVPSAPAITAGGSSKSLDVDVALQKTITFALQATDDAGNTSAIVSVSVTTSFTDDSLAGPASEAEYGASVRSANIDGDSLGDIIVGRTQASTSGGLRILYGNSLTATDVLATQLGLSGAARMGFSVDNAGDLDGDGFDDVIVGAPGIGNAACTAGTGPQTGNAYIFFGGPDGLRVGAPPTACAAGGSADCYIALAPPAAAAADQVCSYGQAVAGVGNVGGISQTRSMIAVGAGDRTASSTRIGKTFLYSLSGTRPEVTLIIVSTLVGGTTDYHFGASLGGVRDVNGDGIPDLVVGAHRRGQPAPGVAGRAYLFLGGSRFAGTGGSVVVTADGSASNDGVVFIQAAGANSGDSFGNACSGASDLNDDGFNDFAIATLAGLQPGVTVVKGRGNLDAVPPSVADLITITGAFTAPGEIAAGQDIDGDGRPDLVLGDQTGAYVFGGDATATVKPAPIATFPGMPVVATGYPVTLISNWKNASPTEAALTDIGIGRGAGPAILVQY